MLFIPTFKRNSNRMAVTTARRPGGRPQYVIIKDKTGEKTALSDEDFESELQTALDEEAEMIILESRVLGNEISRWITVGNFLHKTSVLSGMICCSCQYFGGTKELLIFASGGVSSFCAALYKTSWQCDSCCKFQVAENVPGLENMVTNLNSANPVVLVHRDDRRRKMLHNTIGLLSGLTCAFKVYQWIKS